MPRIIKIEGYCDNCESYQPILTLGGSITNNFYYKCKKCGKNKPRHLMETRKRKKRI